MQLLNMIYNDINKYDKLKQPGDCLIAWHCKQHSPHPAWDQSKHRSFVWAQGGHLGLFYFLNRYFVALSSY
jgi:hypothetical protein